MYLELIREWDGEWRAGNEGGKGRKNDWARQQFIIVYTVKKLSYTERYATGKSFGMQILTGNGRKASGMGPATSYLIKFGINPTGNVTATLYPIFFRYGTVCLIKVGHRSCFHFWTWTWRRQSFPRSSSWLSRSVSSEIQEKWLGSEVYSEFQALNR